jgi:hypothetical protein
MRHSSSHWWRTHVLYQVVMSRMSYLLDDCMCASELHKLSSPHAIAEGHVLSIQARARLLLRRSEQG